jgi:transcriptional regulator with XRE-family HTH domain
MFVGTIRGGAPIGAIGTVGEQHMEGPRAFGAELRRRRQLAGLSLTQLASRIHYSKGYLSKIESGYRAPNPTLARLCDTALNANGALAEFWIAVTEGGTDSRQVDSSAEGAGLWNIRLDPDGTGKFTRSSDDTLVGDVTLFGPIGGSHADPGDAATLLALFGQRFDQARSLGQVLSPGLMLPTLIGETHMLRGLAAGATTDGAPLWRLAAQFSEFVGWMVQELGEDRQAMWWTHYATQMAAIGGDNSFRPYALFRHADIALHADDPLFTIELARRAEVDPASTARVRGLAVQREAQGHAMLGDRESCFRALDRSAALLDEAKRTPTEAPILGTTRTPDPTGMARGWCLFDLGRPAEAAELLEPGIAGFAPNAKRARARYGVRTALAHAASDEVDRACEIVEWLAEDLRRIDSATVRHDVRLLNREFRRRSGQPRVRDLLPILADLLHSPAAPR